MPIPRPLILILLLACNQGPLGQTLHVSPAPDGVWDDPDAKLVINAGSYPSIQAAIDAAASGDTVAIPTGTYTEDLVMREGVTVDGAGIGQTVLNGTVSFTGLSSATLRDLSMIDPDYASSGVRYTNHGVFVDGGGATLKGVSLSWFDHAVHIVGGSNVEVDSSTLQKSWYGLVATNTSSLLVTNNTVLSNGAGGVAAYASSSGSILHNTLVGNAYGASSAYLTGAVAVGTGALVVATNSMTSNYYGLSCSSCSGARVFNNVWGNTTNYINDATADASDLSADPLYADAAAGDYRLSALSPCINAGTNVLSVSTDAAGEARPQGPAVDIGADEYVSSELELLITEVMSNPLVESVDEYVEIYNAGASSVDLSGFRLSDGDELDTLVAFDGGSTTLAAGEWAVIVDPDYAGYYGIDAGVTLLTTSDTEVGNGLTNSDPVTLYESDGTTIIATFSFPANAGDDRSMEMVDLETGDVAGNWMASQCPDEHSPGFGACFPPAGDAGDLIISEVLANATVESTGEYVEIYNSGTLDIDLLGLVVKDNRSTDVIAAFQGGSTLLRAGEHALLIDRNYTYEYFLPSGVVLVTTGDSTIGNGLSLTDSVYLYYSDGTTLIDSFTSPSDPGDGNSVERVVYTDPDASTNWQAQTASCSRGISPGRLNGAMGGLCSGLVITEVMSNPLNEDTGEFVEIYNAGSTAVDVAGVGIADAGWASRDTLMGYAGGTTVIPAGGYAVVLDSEYAGQYTIPAGAILLRTTDSTIGSGLAVTEQVQLTEPGVPDIIETFLWPSNPGNGFSLERIAASGLLDSASNWTAATCASGSSPGAANCVATGSSGSLTSSYDLLITEIMSNPLNESTGEFVEIYNAGTVAVDLLNMVLYDGDAIDTIFGFYDLYDTVLEPGQYGVIFDPNTTGEYSVSGDTLLLTVDDSTVGSGLSTNDPVSFYEADGVSLIDTCSFPFDPGNGVSVERLDLLVGDVTTNWSASTCATGSSPGAANCP